MRGLYIEDLLFNIYFWLIILLLAGIILSLMVLIRYRNSDKQPKNTQARKKPRRKRLKKAGGTFTDKLGEQVVQYMIEVSRSKDRNLLEKRIDQIKKECTRLSQLPLPKENKEIISTVLVWSQNFDIDGHINDLSVFNNSTQIVYEPEKRDFKLLIRQN